MAGVNPKDGEGVEYARALAEAGKAGVPIKMKDLQTPLPPAHQNAAPIYTEFATLLKLHCNTGDDRVLDGSADPGYVVTAQGLQLTATAVQRLRTALQHRSDIVAFVHRAAALQSCVYQQGPEHFATYTGTATRPTVLHMDPQSWNRFMDENGLYMLQEMRKMIPAVDRPYPESNHVLTAVRAEVERADVPQHLICKLMFNEFYDLGSAEARDRAQAAVTMAGTAVMDWRAHHDTFPESLSAAMTHISSDPFDGKAIRYRRLGNGFAVYSVGPTGKYDGGTPNKSPAPREVRFIYRDDLHGFLRIN